VTLGSDLFYSNEAMISYLCFSFSCVLNENNNSFHTSYYKYPFDNSAMLAMYQV